MNRCDQEVRRLIDVLDGGQPRRPDGTRPRYRLIQLEPAPCACPGTALMFARRPRRYEVEFACLTCGQHNWGDWQEGRRLDRAIDRYRATHSGHRTEITYRAAA